MPECNTRPVCYTSFLPNFNPSNTLEAVIVGETADSEARWKKNIKPPKSETMGYKDQKVLFEVMKAFEFVFLSP